MTRLLLLVLAAVLLGSPAPVRAADDWAEARKTFLKAMKSDDWKVRSAGFGELSYFDDAAAVGEVLGVLASERHPAVLLAGIRVLGGFKTQPAQEAVAETVRKGKDPVRLYTILALADQPGAAGKEVLLEALQGKDGQAAAQAALALGKKQVMEALPHLLALLRHKEWRIRAAGARALRLLAGPIPSAQPGKPAPPATPKALAAPDMLGALVDALESGEGRERADILQTLARLTQQDFAWDIPAWRAYVGGTPPADIARKPQHPAYFFGTPVFGRRVVVLVDNNVRTEDGHPFTDRARLQAVSAVPGARPVPWFELQDDQAVHQRARQAHRRGPAFGVDVRPDRRGRKGPQRLRQAHVGQRRLEGYGHAGARGGQARGGQRRLHRVGQRTRHRRPQGQRRLGRGAGGGPLRHRVPAVAQRAFRPRRRRRRHRPQGAPAHGAHHPRRHRRAPLRLCQTLADATGGTYINLSK